MQDWENLEKSKWPQQDSYLRFPIEVERAMMAPRSFRPGPMERPDSAPMPPNEGQEDIFDPGVPGPLDVPNLRP